MSDNTIKISVIIAVYNVEPYLCQCLDSVLSQSLKDLEIICIDDGSTDSSPDILQRYARNDKRIKIISQNNQGPGPARNRGLVIATGEYLTILDTDDFYVNSNSLALLYDNAKNNDALVCGGGVKLLYCPKGEEGDKSVEKYDLFESDGWVDFNEYQDCQYHWRYIFKTQFIHDNNFLYPDLRRGEDPIWCAHVLKKAKQFYAIKAATYVYRVEHKSNKYSYGITLDLLFGELFVLKLANENGWDKMKRAREKLFLGHTRDLVTLDENVSNISKNYKASYIKYYFLKAMSIILPGKTGTYFKNKFECFKPAFRLVRNMRLY